MGSGLRLIGPVRWGELEEGYVLTWSTCTTTPATNENLIVTPAYQTEPRVRHLRTAQEIVSDTYELGPSPTSKTCPSSHNIKPRTSLKDQPPTKLRAELIYSEDMHVLIRRLPISLVRRILTFIHCDNSYVYSRESSLPRAVTLSVSRPQAEPNTVPCTFPNPCSFAKLKQSPFTNRRL